MAKAENGEEFLKIKTWEEYWSRRDELSPLPFDKGIVGHLKKLAAEAGIKLNPKPENCSETERWDIF